MRDGVQLVWLEVSPSFSPAGHLGWGWESGQRPAGHSGGGGSQGQSTGPAPCKRVSFSLSLPSLRLRFLLYTMARGPGGSPCW